MKEKTVEYWEGVMESLGYFKNCFGHWSAKHWWVKVCMEGATVRFYVNDIVRVWPGKGVPSTGIYTGWRIEDKPDTLSQQIDEAHLMLEALIDLERVPLCVGLEPMSDVVSWWSKDRPMRKPLPDISEANLLKYDQYVDVECVNLCNAINEVPFLETCSSCCGHGARSFRVWFNCHMQSNLFVIGRVTTSGYAGICRNNWHCELNIRDIQEAPLVYYLHSGDVKGSEAYVQAEHMAKNIRHHLNAPYIEGFGVILKGKV